MYECTVCQVVINEPKRDVQELHVENRKQKVVHNASIRKRLVQGFKKSQPVISEKLQRNRLLMAVVSIGVH